MKRSVINLVLRISGCLSNDHCAEGQQFCNQVTKTCENVRCPLDIVGGAIVPGSTAAGAEAVLACNEGYLLDFSNEPGLKVVCTEAGNWKSVDGDKVIHP